MRSILAFILGAYEFRKLYNNYYKYPEHIDSYYSGQAFACKLTGHRYGN